MGMVRWFVLGLIACVAVLYLVREGGGLSEPDPAPVEETVAEIAIDGQRADPSPATRPADSIARSETEVIAFSAILDDEKMTRAQRIKALQELGPAALQKPAARNAIASEQPQGAAQRGQRRVRKGPDEYEIKAARRRVDVTMYSTSWCGVCKRARKYFQDEGVDFTEYDVDKNRSARAKYLQLNPRRSVPTIVVDDEVLIGFSRLGFERLMKKAIAARGRFPPSESQHLR